MSLVAYGSSDDSGGSDVDDGETAVIPPKPVDVKKAANEAPSKTEQPAVPVSTKAENSGHISDSDEEDTETDTSAQLLKGLPEPKSVLGGVIEETDVIEDEFKPKPSQVADIEKPKKQRQPVKITIPALQDMKDDSDEPLKKKPRMGGEGKSGLTSILPPPMHAAKKEANRILLPYSLTKKPTPQTSAKPKTLPTTQAKHSIPKDNKKGLSSSLAAYGSDSDDDDDNTAANFFSLDTVSKNDESNNQSMAADSSNSSGLGTRTMQDNSSSNSFVGPALPSETNETDDMNPATVVLPSVPRIRSLHLPSPKSSNTDNSSNATPVGSDNLGSVSYPPAPYAPPVDADAPLLFKGGVSSQKSTGVSAGPSLPSEDNNYVYTNMPYTGENHYPEADSLQAIQHDDEFLRLQGRQQRGREEINIIDINADDYTDPSEITKHLTEEQSYQSHSKKDGGPTSQQKRKHQIGYLAFQAKERELELKNQWSQNKQTRKQTQAKYGF